MPIHYDKRNKRFRFSFRRVVAGKPVRATKLLPRAWDRATAEAFDREEIGRLTRLAAGLSEDDPLIETAVVLYLRDKQHLKSHRTASEHLAAILPAYQGRHMSEIPEVCRLVNEQRGRNDGRGTLADATVHQRLALLRAACRWAWRKHKLVKHDPTGQMILPSVRNERHTYLTREQMLRACRACTNWQAQVAIRVGFYTGMRLGELMSAEADGAVFMLPDTKNGDRRAIPAHPRIRHLMGWFPLTGPKRTVQKAVSRAYTRVGIVDTTFHDLRHSAGSAMVNAGVPLATVGAVLGHRDPRSTMRYAHHNTDTLRDAVDKIGKRRA